MRPRLIDRMKTRRAVLVAAVAGAAVYAFMPSCLGFVPDEDDTLCHALDEAVDGEVYWPDDEPGAWFGDTEGPIGMPAQEHLAFDHADQNPWWQDEAACAYMNQLLAGGSGWGAMGSQDPMSCNEETGHIDTPLGRTYNAYANLVYSHGMPDQALELELSKPLDDFDYYDSFLKWAVAWVNQNTFRMNANCRRDCAGSCTIARTVTGTSARKDYTNLYQTFFYDIDAIWRASTIFHEVRHAREGVLHDGKRGSCNRKLSCDLRWSSAGANTYEAMWLAAYFHTKPGGNEFISDARRARAAVLFSKLRDTAFTEKPSKWNKETLGYINMAPKLYVHQGACSEDPFNLHNCIVLAD